MKQDVSPAFKLCINPFKIPCLPLVVYQSGQSPYCCSILLFGLLQHKSIKMHLWQTIFQLMILSITNYIASVVETWNTSMEHWYNDTDRRNRSTWRNTCPSVSLSTTTEEHAVSFGAWGGEQSPQHTSVFHNIKVPSLSKQYIYGKSFPYKNFIRGIL